MTGIDKVKRLELFMCKGCGKIYPTYESCDECCPDINIIE